MADPYPADDDLEQRLIAHAGQFGFGSTVAVDVGDRHALSSRVLSTIVYYHDKFAGSGGRLVLVNLADDFRDIADAFGIDVRDIDDERSVGARRPHPPGTRSGGAALEAPPSEPDPRTGPNTTT